MILEKKVKCELECWLEVMGWSYVWIKVLI